MFKTTRTMIFLKITLTVFILLVCTGATTVNDYEFKSFVDVGNTTVIASASIHKPTKAIVIDNIIEEEIIIEEHVLTEAEIDLIALVTMAEAEGECEKGQRLVIDSILNRADSKYFPDTIYDVIYQPKHFSSMWNGRVERCEVQEEIHQLVIDELKARTNYDVIFFMANRYSKYGIPMFQVENHYFSSYE